MVYDFHYRPVHIWRAMESINLKHLTVFETAEPEREKDVDEFIQKLADMDIGQFRKFAAGIRRSDMDLVLYALRKNTDEAVERKLMYITGHRRRKSLFPLYWRILQEDYMNSGLLEAMDLMCHFMKKRYESEYRRSLLYGIEGNLKELLYRAHRILQEEQLSLKDFMDKYEIHDESNFGTDLCTMFFSKCEASGFTDNRKEFSMVLESGSSGITAAIENYLKNYEDIPCSDEVNTLLLKQYGDPRERSSMWADMDRKARLQFLQWLYVRNMEKYFGKGSTKLNFWCEYRKNIWNLVQPEGRDTLLIYLGGYVAVESLGESHGSFIFVKEKFGSESSTKRVNTKEGESTLPRGTITAREAILENLTSDVYYISFESLGRLYAAELLKRELAKTECDISDFKE